jgi:hypothetical protein
MTRVFINLLFFQLGWWSCVIGAAHGWPWLGPLVVAPLLTYHLRTSADRRSEILFLLVVALVGTAMDSLLALSGVVSYRGGGTWPLAPVWITALWIIFGTTLNVSMRWLVGRPGLALVLGALAGPSTYYGAARLGAVEISNTWTAWVVLGTSWGLALPTLLWIVSRRTYRPETHTSR